MWIEYKKNVEGELTKAIVFFKKGLENIRGNRPSTGLINGISLVDSYGINTKIPSLGTTSIAGDSIMINVWDKKNIPAVEKSIRNSNLGLSPVVNDTTIIVKFPQLTTEGKEKIMKVISKKTEDSKITIRKIRKISHDAIKLMKKNSEISEDDEKKYSKDLDPVIKHYMNEIDNSHDIKYQEIKNS